MVVRGSWKAKKLDRKYKQPYFALRATKGIRSFRYGSEEQCQSSRFFANALPEAVLR
jgi:hypothetical protein